MGHAFKNLRSSGSCGQAAQGMGWKLSVCPAGLLAAPPGLRAGIQESRLLFVPHQYIKSWNELRLAS